MSGIVAIACDMNDNLYVMSDHSESLVAFSPEGKPLFTYYFEVALSGSSEMMSKTDNTVVVDYNGDGSTYYFKNNKLIKTLTANQWPHGDKLWKNFKPEEVYSKGGLTAKDSKGRTFKANPLTAQISVTDNKGNRTHFVGDTFGYWLINYPFPCMIWMAFGFSGIVILGRIKRERF